MRIVERLGEIQRILKSPKDLRNKFAGYDYRNIEGIIDKVKPLLKEGEAFTITYALQDCAGRAYLKATASFRCGADSLECSAFARESVSRKGMDEPQLTCAAQTYAARYAAQGLLAIDNSEHDLDALPPPDALPNKKSKPTKEEIMSLFLMGLEKNIIMEEVERRGMKSSTMTREDFYSLIEWINRQKR